MGFILTELLITISFSMPNYNKYFSSYESVEPTVRSDVSFNAPLPSFLQTPINSVSASNQYNDSQKEKNNGLQIDIPWLKEENKNNVATYRYIPKPLIKNTTPIKTTINSIINYAETMVGKPYKFGGLSNTKGTDCSGLVYLSYKQAGINIPRTVKGMESFGQEVKSINDIQPGDLLCYNSSRSPSGRHVTMVSNIDENGIVYVINASGKDRGIVKEPANLKNIKTIRRPLTTIKTE